HETAPLRHRHHLYVHLAHLAAAANPLLRPAARAVGDAAERWADEVDAAEVGGRSLAARAVARAALAQHRSALATLGAADGDVPGRVRALLIAPSATSRVGAAM